MSDTAVNPLPGIPLVESPFFDRFFERPGVDPLIQKLARQLRSDGYAVFDFPAPDFAALADQVIRDLSPRFDFHGWRTRKQMDQTGGLRIQDAITLSTAVRDIANNRRIMDILAALFGRRPFPFQTLNFPVGTEQRYHTDSIHFSSMPERFMCGVWVALEDIGDDQGPLYYYPGSHKLPIYDNHHYGLRYERGQVPFRQASYEEQWRQIVAACGFEEAVFKPRKGQALIWLANLFHGGKRHLDASKTRWSQVTHYYFEDCAYYTPMHSHIPSGVIYFREPMDISTGTTKKNRICGKPISEEFIKQATPDLSQVDPAHLPDGFDGNRYLELNPDLKAIGIDPTVHYLGFGQYEDRRYR